MELKDFKKHIRTLARYGRAMPVVSLIPNRRGPLLVLSVGPSN